MIEKLKNSNFFKSIFTLTSGTIIAQVITFLASPIMTRLYAPEEIGLYTLIITAVSLFGNVIAGRYDMAIVVENNEDNVDTLILLSLIISTVASIIIGILYTIYNFFTSTIEMSFVFFLISVTILLFLTGLRLITSAYSNRKEDYSLISKSSIYESITKEFTLIGIGLVSPTAEVLVLSQIIGRIANLIIQLKIMPKRTMSSIKNSAKELSNVANKYKEQLLYSVPALFANSFSYSSINIFIEQLFGTAVLGFYSMSYRVLGIPLTLVSGSVSKVYFREASKEFNRNNTYKRTFIKTSLFLIAISIPMVIVLMFIAPSLFSIVFGDEWSVAGEYVRLLAPMFGVRLIVSPLTTGMIISKKQKHEVIIQSFFVIASIMIFIIVLNFGLSINQYLIMINVIYTIIYIIYYFILFKLSLKIK